MYIIPSHWRLIILQQGVWEVAPVSELDVEAVLIKLHAAGKGAPTDMARLTLHLRIKEKHTTQALTVKHLQLFEDDHLLLYPWQEPQKLSSKYSKALLTYFT